MTFAHAVLWHINRGFALITVLACLPLTSAFAANGSGCVAMADAQSRHIQPRLVPVALQAGEVRITFVTHATFRIESAGGVVVVTDYAGLAGEGPLPDVVTMNHAHETHYTDFPDSRIPHVLRGWNPDGGAARHHLQVRDVLVRNVPTDIRRWDGGREAYGNSIFIFEVAGLCIGHLGHLHHELAPQDLGQIGQLDIVLAPVDGTFTIDHATMAKVLRVLKARVVIPMHAFGQISIDLFVQRMGADYAVVQSQSSTLVTSAAKLPRQRTIHIMPEQLVWSYGD